MVAVEQTTRRYGRVRAKADGGKILLDVGVL
jgi:hypothetical protein